jgi:ABC-type iron transport system FetAB permease component
MRIDEKIIKYGSFILVFLAPLLVWGSRLYPHISSKTFFMYGMAEVVFFTWIYAIIVDPTYRLSKKTWAYFIPAFIFIIWMTISGILAKSSELSFWSSFGRGTGLITLYHCLALSVVVTSFIKKNKMSYVVSLMSWFIAGATVLAMSIWMSTDGLRFQIKTLVLGGGGGLMSNSSLAATYTTFALAFSAYLLCVKETPKNLRIRLWGAIALIIFSPLFINIVGIFNGAGIIGNARAAVISLPLILIVFSIFYLFYSPVKKIRYIGVFGLLVGMVISSVLWVKFLNPDTKIHQKFIENATGTRFLFWQSAQDAMDSSPIFGYGPENYAVAFQKHFKPAMLLKENGTEGWNDRAHNIYYEMGVWGGYPGVIIYAVFIFMILYAVYTAWKKQSINRRSASIFSALIFGYVFQNFFAFDSTLSLMALFIAMGVIFSMQEVEENKKKNNEIISQQKTNFFIVLLVVLFIISWFFMVYKPVKKVKLLGKVFGSSIKERPEQYKKLLINPSIGDQWDVSQMAFNSYKAYASNPVKIKNDKALVPFAVADLQALLEYLENISNENKIDYRLYIVKAYLYNTIIYLDGKSPEKEVFDKVMASLNYAKVLSPTNPHVYWAEAQIKVWWGDLEGAEQAYRDAIDIFPALSASNTLFVNYAKAINDQELYKEALSIARKNIPGFVIE